MHLFHNLVFEDDLAYENETTEKNYFLSTKIKYKTHKLNAVRYQEYQKEKLVTFNYITNLKTNNHNIKNIIKMGRSSLGRSSILSN